MGTAAATTAHGLQSSSAGADLEGLTHRRGLRHVWD
jgi:hypothetical protein